MRGESRLSRGQSPRQLGWPVETSLLSKLQAASAFSEREAPS